MRSMLKLITGPAQEPVTVANVKTYTHIDHDVDDTLVAGWIKAGRIAAENYQWRAYYTQEWELSFDGWPDFPVMLPRPPLVTLESLKYYDTDDTEYSFDTNDLIVDIDSTPGRIALAYNVTLPTTTLREINAVKFRYIAGYDESDDLTTTAEGVISAIPDTVKDAIYLYCAWRNENRAGETETPKQFFDILRPDRVYLP